MKRLILSALATLTLVAGCSKEAAAGTAPTPTAVAPVLEAPKKPALVELDLSKWGPAFKGYVALAPAGSTLEFDDPSRQLKISENDYLNLNEAPFFEDALASIGKGDDTVKNVVKKVTEATWERTAPIGAFWSFDVLVTTGKDKWSCNGETLTDATTRAVLVDVCKSIKKK
jgi:hypothetical protein